ncbi:hypothetical protein H5410_033803 [Solanum commersonii]|uniref:Uncharacterized protein n=1 Tax=Solanum commersonii TaxID=4109 RepID=A0A9J5YPN6_SOLCO|nr:hypothetical protein H5410_033803 [Solanum commersonii]
MTRTRSMASLQKVPISLSASLEVELLSSDSSENDQPRPRRRRSPRRPTLFFQKPSLILIAFLGTGAQDVICLVLKMTHYIWPSDKPRTT